MDLESGLRAGQMIPWLKGLSQRPTTSESSDPDSKTELTTKSVA